jgi:LacI family kdg operon repressor
MKRKIKDNESKRVTISDVASLAGVSKTTVSRYLSGQYDALAEETCTRIAEAVKELDYRPNIMAQGLKGNRSKLIGIVVADITNPFSTAVLRGAEDVCKKNNYSIMVCNTDNDPAKERDYIFMLQSHRIDGLIITTTGENNEFLLNLTKDNIPVVLLDRRSPEAGFDMVVTDNRGTTSKAVAFLINQGYKKIGFFSGPIGGITTRAERLDAFRSIFSNQKNSEVQSYEYEINFDDPNELEQKLDAFLSESKGQVPAIFAVNGVIMLKIILALQKKGLRIPDDIAVMGFDNLDWTPAVGSGITVIEQPTYELGVVAMERVLKRIEDNSSLPENIELPTKLIIRGSTPPQNKAGEKI